MATYRIGSVASMASVLTGIVKERFWCSACHQAGKSGDAPAYLAIWHSIIVAVELDLAEAERKLAAVDRLSLIGWLDQAQREALQWQRRYHHLYRDVERLRSGDQIGHLQFEHLGPCALVKNTGDQLAAHKNNSRCFCIGTAVTAAVAATADSVVGSVSEESDAKAAFQSLAFIPATGPMPTRKCAPRTTRRSWRDRVKPTAVRRAHRSGATRSA